MKKKLIVVGVLVLAAISIYKYITRPDGKTVSFTTKSMYYNVMEDELSTTNAYIDASGSMKGYFSLQSDSRFITTISNANPSKLMWMDGRYTEIKGIPTNQLLTNRFSGGDSRFDKMLSNIIIRDSLQKSDILALLFTDGILSASKRETDGNSEYMPQSFGIFKNYIANEIKKTSGIAIAIYKLESKYNGTYWNYQNNKNIRNLCDADVDIKDRPFYVIAMGKPAQIRYFANNNKLNAALSAMFGIYKDTLTNNPGSTFTVNNPSLWENGGGTGKLVGKEVGFVLTLPKYIADFGSEYIKKNLIIEFDNKNESQRLLPVVNINGQNLSITNWQTDDVNKPIITPGEHTLEVKIRKVLPVGWDSLYSEDDRKIKSVVAEQKKTFALEYLIKGIQEGTEVDDFIIFSSSITFEK